MQILFLHEVWSSISFSIVSGIFSTVSRVYDIMIDLVINNGSFDSYSFSNLTTTMYVLAGVFMLFRVAIGMIQMLLNPDLVSDKQAGAGKMITRIITSLILLLVFVPNGLLFGEDGLFRRVERAVLADDGIIFRIMPVGGNIKEKYSDNVNAGTKNDIKDNILIENVSADTKKLTCYYVDKKEQVWTNPNSASAPGTVRSYYYNLGYVYKIEFYNDSTTGKTGHLNCDGSKCKYSYTVKSEQRINGDSSLGYYASIDKAITRGNVFGDSFPTSCPKSFKEVDGHLAAQKKFQESGNSLADCGNNSGAQKTIDTQCWNSETEKMQSCKKTGLVCKNVGIQGGYSSYSKLKKALNDLKLSPTGASYSVASPSQFIRENTSTSATDDAAENKKFLNNLKYRDASIAFAQNTAKSFQECTTDKEKDCKEAQKEMFSTTEGNSDVVNLIKDEDMHLDFITSVIVGIGLIIYLLILCVDVIVRKFKLLLLEMIAPIPIISYVDPKDKVFNQWLKMYVSIYVELFIKLLAIALAINLLDAVEQMVPDSSGLLVRFFYIVGILVFAKAVPDIISNLFNLKSMGGSFKNIIGMAKGAAGFGAGAVLGAAAGAASGRGLGRISGFAKGALMGAGSGAKGKITGGAQGISAKNAKINDAKANGLGFWQRTAAGLAGSVGYSPKTRMDNKIKDVVDNKEMLDNFRKHKDNIESAADSSAFLKDKMTKYNNGEISWQDYKNARSKFIAANDALRQGKITRTKDSNGNEVFVYKDQRGFEHTSSDMGYFDENGNFQALSGAKYEGSAYGKIEDAEKNLKVELETSGSLKRSLLDVKDADGNALIDSSQLQIDSFSDYEKLEKVALEGSKQANKEIIKVQKSDKYGRAQAFDDYSKKS